MSTAAKEYIETKLGRNEAHIWSIDTNIYSPKIKYYLTLLSLEEIQRARSYTFQRHSDLFVIRRAILRIILSFYLYIYPRDILITADNKGKPRISYFGSKIQFNLSHANDFAYYIISHGPCVGIDVEHIQTWALETDLLTLVLHPEEYKFIEKFSFFDKKKLFYQYWSQKEALLKATGKGLSYSPSNIHIDLNNRLLPRLIRFDQEGNIDNWSLSLIKTPLNYVGCIAFNGALHSIKYQRFMGNEYE